MHNDCMSVYAIPVIIIATGQLSEELQSSDLDAIWVYSHMCLPQGFHLIAIASYSLSSSLRVSLAYCKPQSNTYTY